MIRKSHSIRHLMNRVFLITLGFLLMMFSSLTYYVVQLVDQQENTIFRTHVMQLASELDYQLSGTDYKSHSVAKVLKEHLETTADLADFYEITDEQHNVVVRMGTNHGDEQYQTPIGQSGLLLTSRKKVADLLTRSRTPLYLVAGFFFFTIMVVFILFLQVSRLIHRDFRQVSGALDMTSSDRYQKQISEKLYLDEFYDLHQQLYRAITEIKTVSAFMEDETRYDFLTHLQNEKGFSETQHRYISIAKRDIPVVMVLFDIDDLSLINQELGKEQGDLVIKGIADILRGSVQDADECFYRQDGQFLVLMVDMDIADALKWYEFLTRRFDVLEQSLLSFKHSSLHLSVSASTTKLSLSEGGLDEALRRCQTVLATVKEQGKGIIVKAREPHKAIPDLTTQKAVNDERDNLLQADFHHPWQ